MNRLSITIVFVIVASLFYNCTGKKSNPEINEDNTGNITSKSLLLAKNNLMAWCIVPFDSKKRDPTERVKMMADLGITKYAWDWRDEHLDQLGEEIDLLNQHHIELSAVWFWVNGTEGNVIDEKCEKILNTLKEKGVQTTLWVSFNNSFFEGIPEDEVLVKAVEAIGQIHDRATAQGCRIGLYNHGGWFGEPENQITVIEKLGGDNIGIIYNFHHGLHQIEGFGELLNKMLPYLYTINLNGMDPDREMILPLGQGKYEQAMIQTLLASGYEGPVGILGHVDTEDVRIVLERNLKGLKGICENLGLEQAAATY